MRNVACIPLQLPSELICPRPELSPYLSPFKRRVSMLALRCPGRCLSNYLREGRERGQSHDTRRRAMNIHESYLGVNKTWDYVKIIPIHLRNPPYSSTSGQVSTVTWVKYASQVYSFHLRTNEPQCVS